MVGVVRALANLGSNELEHGIELLLRKRPDADVHGHALYQASDFGFVDSPFEKEVGHVGHGGDSCSVVEGVAHHDRVSHFDRDVEYETVDGGADERGGKVGHRSADTLFGDLQRISGAVDLFAILTQSKACLFKLFGRNEVVGIEFVGTVEVGLRLLDVHLGEANATFGSIDL